jgi:hypothetical protein
MAKHIERRKFLATLGGAVAAWPLAARAQQLGKPRRIGFSRRVLHPIKSRIAGQIRALLLADRRFETARGTSLRCPGVD